MGALERLRSIASQRSSGIFRVVLLNRSKAGPLKVHQGKHLLNPQPARTNQGRNDIGRQLRMVWMLVAL